MATDARGHTAPASGETPRRQSINDLSLSINDIIPVANETARAQKVVDVVTAGHAWPRPLLIYRGDAPAGRELEVTRDGTTWRTITAADTAGEGWKNLTAASGFTSNSAQGRRFGSGRIDFRGRFVGTFAANTNAVMCVLPAAMIPDPDSLAPSFAVPDNGAVIGWGTITMTGQVIARFPSAGQREVSLNAFSGFYSAVN